MLFYFPFVQEEEEEEEEEEWRGERGDGGGRGRGKGRFVLVTYIGLIFIEVGNAVVHAITKTSLLVYLFKRKLQIGSRNRKGERRGERRF